MTPQVLTRAQITRLLAPRSIAVVGASDKPGALGATVISNLDRNGFTGEIYPINPNRAMIGNRQCLASIDALPDGIDVAVLAIPRAGVLDALRALCARGVGAAIIFAAGFAEGGPEGAAEQAEIARLAQSSHMVIEGPNCLGLVNHVSATPLTFVETSCVAPNGARAVGIVSQSGAMAAVLSTTLIARSLPVSYSVSTGNEAASGVEVYVGWLIDDPDTHVIAMIVEQFRKPARFLELARAAHAAGKPIVLLHPGKSSAARVSAATHTGAMAGDYQLMRAKVERAGVVFAHSLEELGDIAEILTRCAKLIQPSVAVLGESGAFKALTLDLAEEIGLPLATLNDADSPTLRAALPPFVPVSNPLDITAQGLSQPEIYTHTLTALLDDSRVGSVVAGIIQSDPLTAQIKIPAILKALEGGYAKPLLFAGLDEGADMPAHFISALRGAGVPWFPSSERAMRALAAITKHVARDFADATPAPIAVPGLAQAHGKGRKAQFMVPEYRAKALLAPLGVSFPQGRFAASVDECEAAADALGYPVAMKAQAAKLGHKSDAGGVLLNLASPEQVHAAWGQIHSNVAKYDAAIALDGVLVEAMGKRGVEMIVGGRNDPEWGPIVLAGFGGVTAEILADVRLFTPDLSEKAVIASLMQLKTAASLAGYRGSPPLDVTALAKLIRKVTAILLAEPSLTEIDLNPVIIYPDGDGVIALDALMLVN